MRLLAKRLDLDLEALKVASDALTVLGLAGLLVAAELEKTRRDEARQDIN